MHSNISRRRFLGSAVLGSAAVALSSRLGGQPANLPRKPSLLVFLPDQLRADTIVGERSTQVHAPNLHKLAAQSVAFERAYVTQPVCTPSRSSLLSGTWPHLNGCEGDFPGQPHIVLPRKFRCLPEMLDDPDYRTGYFGKWHLGDEFSAQHGFEEWTSVAEFFKSAVSDHKIDGVSDYAKFLISKGYKPDMPQGKYFGQKFISALPFEVSRPKFLETRACEFLQQHRENPFLLFVAFVEPHPPYNGPFNNEHPIESISLDSSVDDIFGNDVPLRARLRQELFRRRLRTTDRYREVKQRYLGLITEIDHCIGNILSKLDELGLSERTITVLTSDHGDMMSAHGFLGKRFMFEQSTRVPYLVRVPGHPPLQITQPVSHIDFPPTMLDLLGKNPDPQCVGKSRAPLIRGETMAPESVFIEWSPGKEKINKHTKLASKDQVKQALTESTRAIITPDAWKLCLRDKDKNELYNLQDDPDERRNLYSDRGRRDIVQRLTTDIRRWQEQVGDNVKV